MSIWRKPDGEEVVRCDSCGVTEDGTAPDDLTWVKLDMTNEILKAGAPAGTELQVRDYCPDCKAVQSSDQENLRSESGPRPDSRKRRQS